jgi:hypothetical protein
MTDTLVATSEYRTPIQPPLSPISSIFDRTELFATWEVEIAFVDLVMGGIPQDPAVMEGWLRKKFTGDSDLEIRNHMLRELEQLGVDVEEGMDMDQLYEAARKVAKDRQGNTFFRDEHGLYLSAYQPKAAIKEAVNILWGDTRMGPTRKGAKPYVAERVFVPDQRIYLGRHEPDGTRLIVGHVTGPQGPRSTLTNYDFVRGGTATFTILGLKQMLTQKDGLSEDMIRLMMILMEENGLGALRSMGHGAFRVRRFDRIS